MSDDNPFDTYEPTNEQQYEDQPHIEDGEESEEEEEDEEESGDDDGDDPFADVDGPTINNNTMSAPAFQNFSTTQEPIIEEETPLSIWEKERAQVLRDRQEAAQKQKEENLREAKEEAEKFFADQQVRLEKQKKTNRADEKNYKQDTAQIFETGTKWEKVNRLVSVAPKAGEKPGSSRVERYRKLLIQMKVEGQTPKKSGVAASS